MGKKIFILLVVALIGMLVLPALASATLVNSYGMHYVGQGVCLSCHAKGSIGAPLVTNALHGKFATAGINPSPPSTWTLFKAAGDITPVKGSGQIRFKSGGSYGFDMPWITL